MLNDCNRDDNQAVCAVGAQPEGKAENCKGLCEKLRHKFHVSVIESDAQDIHQTIVVSVAYLTDYAAAADSIGEAIRGFIVRSTDAEIVDVWEEKR